MKRYSAGLAESRVRHISLLQTEGEKLRVFSSLKERLYFFRETESHCLFG